MVTCADEPFVFDVFSEPPTAAMGDDEPAGTLRQVLGASQLTGDRAPNGWRRLSVTDNSIEFGRGEPPILGGYVVLERMDGVWTFKRSGETCAVRAMTDGTTVKAGGRNP